MLRGRYPPVRLPDSIPPLDHRPDPRLADLDRLLDDDELSARVRADLARRLPTTRPHGRPSTPVEVPRRVLAVTRPYGWGFARARRLAGDRLVLRQFGRLYRGRPPDRTALMRGAHLIGLGTLQRLNDRAGQLARSRRVTRGRKPRVGTTAVATDVRRPCDSGLLGDGIRVIARLLRRARPATAGLGRGAFRNRTRTARRLARRLRRPTRRGAGGRTAELKGSHSRRTAAAASAASQAERVPAALRATAGRRARRAAAGRDVTPPRLGRVIRQARRRGLGGEAVPARGKRPSPFEPHARLVPRHEAGHAIELGRPVRLDGVGDRHRVPSGGPGWRTRPPVPGRQPGHPPPAVRTAAGVTGG